VTALFELLVNTGGRRCDALALHCSDIDLDARLLRVRGTLTRVSGELIVTETKTPRSRRVVPLSPAADRLLRNVRANQRAERLRAGSMWQPTPYVFTTELGEPCDPRNARRALKTAANRAGLPLSVGLHTLRAPCPGASAPEALRVPPWARPLRGRADRRVDRRDDQIRRGAGWETMEAWEAGTSSIVAVARSAMKRCVAGGIALSSATHAE
jgi:hypothetical protein